MRGGICVQFRSHGKEDQKGSACGVTRVALWYVLGYGVRWFIIWTREFRCIQGGEALKPLGSGGLIDCAIKVPFDDSTRNSYGHIHVACKKQERWGNYRSLFQPTLPGNLVCTRSFDKVNSAASKANRLSSRERTSSVSVDVEHSFDVEVMLMCGIGRRKLRNVWMKKWMRGLDHRRCPPDRSGDTFQAFQAGASVFL